MATTRTRFVHASSLIANLDEALEFVNQYGESQDEYPIGVVTDVTQIKMEWIPDPVKSGWLVGPVTMTVAGVTFTVISGALGVKVYA